MGLDATVSCNCFKEGRTTAPPIPREWLYLDSDGYWSCRPENDSDSNFAELYAWEETCCAHIGNHDLNILLGEEKYDNNWFYGREFHHDGKFVPQAPIHDEQSRRSIQDFFRRLPLVLERPDLRIVHACWHGEMVEVARQATNVMELYDYYVRLIEADISKKGLDEIDTGLAFQNRNPVKVLTSGQERRVAVPFESGGKVRHEERVPWWHEYKDEPYCVFGHYASFRGEPHGHGRAICLDYGVTKRHRERLKSGFTGAFRGKLAALRWPAQLIVFDDGTTEKVPAI